MQTMQHESTTRKAQQAMKDLILRWTFGETDARPTSLQAFDMLECSIRFAKILFPKASKYVVVNYLKSKRSEFLLKEIQERTQIPFIFLPKSKLLNTSIKNSFHKYIPSRIAINKYEIFLDSDVILWTIPQTIQAWYGSNGLLINTDWNPHRFGIYSEALKKSHYNAGIVGLPPKFTITLPDLSQFPELFHSEQGYTIIQLLKSGLPIFAISKKELFQANAKDWVERKYPNLTKDFAGAHFCGNNYAHYFHWDKFYKEEIWNLYYKKLKEYETVRNNKGNQ